MQHYKITHYKTTLHTTLHISSSPQNTPCTTHTPTTQQQNNIAQDYRKITSQESSRIVPIRDSVQWEMGWCGTGSQAGGGGGLEKGGRSGRGRRYCVCNCSCDIKAQHPQQHAQTACIDITFLPPKELHSIT